MVHEPHDGVGQARIDVPAAHPPRAEPGSECPVLFVRRKPRMFGATYGPIRSDPGTITIERDYLELNGNGVKYRGLAAVRIILPCILFLPGFLGGIIAVVLVLIARTQHLNVIVPCTVLLTGPVAALIAFYLVEYVFTTPSRAVIPFIQIHRVLLDPLRGTLMIGVGPKGGTVTWHSFATAYAWAIFDELEPLLEDGACGLLTRRERALARGDLAMFLAMCSMTPVVGIASSLVGIGAGLLAAALGKRRYGLIAVGLCLITLAGQGVLIHWWVTF